MEKITTSTQEKVAADKRLDAHYRLFFAQFSQAVPAVLVLIALNTYNLSSTVSAYLLYPWAGLLLLMYFIRSRVKHRYDKALAAGTVGDTDWGRYIVIGSGLTGLLWGLSAILFLVGVEMQALTFMVVVVIIMVSGNTVTHAAIKNASLAFSTMILMPYVILLFSRGSALDIQIAVAMLLLYVTMLRQGRVLIAIVAKNISLSDDYISTIKQLETTQRQSLELITTLEHEIREKNHAERQLQGVESRYQRAELLGGFGHWQWDVDANKTVFSKEASKLFYDEYEGKQLIGDIYSHLGKLVHPDDYVRLYNAIDHVVKKGGTLDQKVRLISHGRETWLHIRADVIGTDSNKTLCGVVRDVSTEMLMRQRMEQNISSVHTLALENQTLMDQFARALIKVNGDGDIERINQAMNTRLGLEEQDSLMLIGMPLESLIGAETRGVVHQAIQSCQAVAAQVSLCYKTIASEAIALQMTILPLCHEGVYSGMLLIENPTN